ncbi:MAG: phospholipid-binding protein [Cellvibrionales bacterium TMED122]|nr:phospholipid-binding protein [Halieaceae bacterium]OUV64041.1 MAG: phospholipid-binding protein [Cellvibrionales bacterium TMED122]
MPVLLGMISGCGSIMSSAGAGPIEEDPGERTFGQQMTDESIETKAKVNINAADEGYDTAHLSVVSFNGFVLLVGQVPSEELKTLATDVVRKIEDVRRIYNELEVGEATGAGARTNDTWITTQVKSKLLASSDTPGRRVKVVTENSVVYLMGLLTEAEAERVALEAAEVGSIERVVQLFELIPAPPI